jgi:hypothetical protein
MMIMTIVARNMVLELFAASNSLIFFLPSTRSRGTIQASHCSLGIIKDSHPPGGIRNGPFCDCDRRHIGLHSMFASGHESGNSHETGTHEGRRAYGPLTPKLNLFIMGGTMEANLIKKIRRTLRT